jgi:hypothetical protein
MFGRTLLDVLPCRPFTGVETPTAATSDFLGLPTFSLMTGFLGADFSTVNSGGNLSISALYKSYKFDEQNL